MRILFRFMFVCHSNNTFFGIFFARLLHSYLARFFFVSRPNDLLFLLAKSKLMLQVELLNVVYICQKKTFQVFVLDPIVVFRSSEHLKHVLEFYGLIKMRATSVVLCPKTLEIHSPEWPFAICKNKANTLQTERKKKTKRIVYTALTQDVNDIIGPNCFTCFKHLRPQLDLLERQR